MGDIIKFERPDDGSNGYIIYDDDYMTAYNKTTGIQISADEAWIQFGDGLEPFYFESRKELAEFLWLAAYFVDSDERWAADGYVARDY